MLAVAINVNGHDVSCIMHEKANSLAMNYIVNSYSYHA